MRIVLIGQAAFGEAVFKALRERGEEVVGVCAPATPEGGRPDPLRAAAEAAGLPVLPTRRLRRDEAVVQQYLDLKPDLNVMAFVTDIIPERVLFAPPLQTIQYHPSLLPRHRGASAINWAIIQGDAITGLTIFWPDKGIDTGPILLQKDVPIGPDDTVTSLYFNHLFPLGVEAMVESVQLVRQGTAPRIEQDHSQATYEAICRDEHTWIDWHAAGGAVYNLVRGANPTPGAGALFRGAPIKLFDSARLTDAAGGTPGAILAVGDQGVTVALADGALLVKRVQVPGGPKTPAAEWARAAAVAVGERFTAGPPA
ncbi:MAG: methionyl-tRNA formyltransferase [Dehalococcoidia bacterium]